MKYTHSDRVKEQLSRAAREMWQRRTPEERARLLAPWIEAGISATARKPPSALEKLAASILERWDIPFTQQHRIGQYIVDFAFPNGFILEIDGGYFHKLPKQQAHDRKRASYLAGLGYDVIRLKESDIKDDAEGSIRAALRLGGLYSYVRKAEERGIA